ncbi:uncharacterized protein LOC124159056 isoform X2 [Ischnura elegans]|nr:uncharacterized protein LOC124159056 isoform X2 [Ischnura elegans]
MCLTYIPEKDLIAGGLSNGKTFLYSISKGVVVRTLQKSDSWKKHMAITSLHCLASIGKKENSFSNREVLITTNVIGGIKMWNWREKMLIHSIDEPQPIYSSAVGHGKLITVGKNSAINIYDLITFQNESSLKKTTQRDAMSGHTSRIFVVKVHPINVNEYVTAGWDNLVLFWDRRRPLPIRSVFGPHICGDSIDISSDGQKLLTCSWSIEDSVQVWDYKTGKMLSTSSQNHNFSKNYAGKWATKEVAICGGIDPNALKVTAPEENNVLGGCLHLPMGVYAIQLCGSKESWVVRQKIPGFKTMKGKYFSEKEEGIHLPATSFSCGPYLYSA